MGTKNILKNFIFVAFIAFVFGISFSFVSADATSAACSNLHVENDCNKSDECYWGSDVKSCIYDSCSVHTPTECASYISNCKTTNGKCINKNKNVAVVLSTAATAVTTTTSSDTRGTGGLVPCVDDCTAEDLFGNSSDYANKPPIWTSLIRTALGISGIFILVMFVYGGVRMIISKGQQAQIKAATDIMKNSIIGLLIVIFAYTFVKFIVIALVDKNWAIFFGG